MRRYLTTTISVAAAAAVSATAGAHVDVLVVGVQGQPSRLETGAFDFDGFALAEAPPTRLYENDLDEPLPGADLLVGEAGFTGMSATAAAALLGGTGYTNLPGGVDVRFDFRSFGIGGGSANLWYWDGIDADADGDFADDVSFAPASGTSLAFEKSGVFSASVNGAAADVPGFVIDTTAMDDPGTSDDETGFMHFDLDATLDDGDADPLTAVPTGIYAVSVTVSTSAHSEPIYWVYNAGLGEAGEAAAEAALGVVPEPATLTALALVGVLAARRR